jgi:hypothetical protein
MTLKQLQYEAIEEFNKKFDNFVYWKELISELQIGDPDFYSFLKFVEQQIAKACEKTIETIKLEKEEEYELDIKHGGHLKWCDWNYACDIQEEKIKRFLNN